MSDTRNLVRSTWGITAWTVVSRVAGFLRDATIARFLGASAASDAFYTALRIPNTFRAIVGEGGLPGAFVPMAKKVARERPGEEGVYAGRMLVLLVCVLVGIVTLGIVFAEPVVALFANGFKATPGKFELTVRLTRWMFPYILLVSVAALLEAFLNAKGFFQLSAATPILWNLAIVASAWLLAPAGVSPVVALTVGVLVGGGLQVALQGPAVRRLGLRFSGSPFRDAHVKRTALQIAPRLYGSGVGQLSLVVSTRTLAALGDAFVTYNFCAFRIVDFVLGGFVVSLTRTILPSLSDQALEKDRSTYKATVGFALRLIGFVTIPSMVGLMLLASPVVDVIFRRGRFGVLDVEKTALAVVFFAVGLYAAAGVKIVTQAFYALHDTRTPVIVATFDLAVFWVMCVWLAKSMQHAGVALATAAGFWINFLVLLFLLRKRLGGMGGRAVLESLFRLLLASLAMGAVVWAVSAKLVPYRMIWNFPMRIGWVAAVAALGAVSFVAFANALRAPEVGEVLGALRRKKASS
ncbi:MAG: murein biosynthesis integral membrane protein MurJ [Acidobacteriota bacterium]|nr:murein biosynthesis integral membrane protein MurJ [Acidobacteriota bacterium]